MRFLALCVALLVATAAATCGYGGCTDGDPHFTGFNGQIYKIDGISGKVFNWYTDADIQVNCRIEMMLNSTKATYVSACGIRFGQNIGIRLVVFPKFFSKITPHNMIEHPSLGTIYQLDPCGYSQWIGQDTLVSYWQHYTVTLTRRVKAIRNEPRFDFLNVKIAAEARTPHVHGLLGQTMNNATANVVSEGNQGEGVIEGTIEDYIVPDGLYGGEFKFNQFRGLKGVISHHLCKTVLPFLANATSPTASSSAPTDEDN